ncbi:MAG: hypothetical protein Q7S27_05575 [Nanoarchaeota archaeon]|nr:hypothetical protein [Nanoarchaeota archaeon]
MERELSSKELYKIGKLYERESKIAPEERKRIGSGERFMDGSTQITIMRFPGQTSIYEKRPGLKIMDYNGTEHEVGICDHLAIISTQMSEDEVNEEHKRRRRVFEMSENYRAVIV